MTQADKKQLGTAIQESYEDAISDWLAEYARSAKRSDIFADKLREASISVQILSGGRVHIQVGMMAKKPWESQLSFFKYATRSGGLVRVHSPTRSSSAS